ncbi:EspA/EspE family type VII secretion system effector [Mycolicibacterium neworleansense]|uniref:ESX-1 secretion-associated protein EspA/EspE-like domain-containing protein n=1 Tax=Mycolicibacterium neworleansense TaxID=146018 RepID=A0A0H5S7G8_9MYCO|nr:EspA/EspE family type VII secretion system effector [Mycolicibacterium neworleansense]MCV7363291.1 hypothetical protein [Mycolicibacterium neworleansense]CRZ17184.1 hypothetical protein BN2156_04065 [Mycolicibacterium neworleansense]
MGLWGDIADLGKGVIENNLKWTERAARAGSQIVDLGQRLIRVARSPILVAGQQTIESMKHSTGVGDPETGQRFDEGADKMGAVGQVLVSAFPEDTWNSGGAAAYAGRNTEQVGRVQTMLGLDHMVAGVLATEAGQIAAARDSLDGHSDWLGAMSLLTTSAGIIPGFGTAAQMSAEFAMVAKAVGDSSGDLKTLSGHVDQNAAVLRSAATQYETLAGGAAPNGAEFGPPVDDPQAGPESEDAGATAPGGSAGGGGGGSPTGDSPTGGGGAGAPTGSAGPAAAPSMPANMSTAGAAPPPAAAADAAGALGGILGSLVGPLGGILGGLLQAFGQAAQVAGQAGTQAAQMAGQAAGQPGGGQLDKASGDAIADADEFGQDEDRDRDKSEASGQDESAEGKDKDEDGREKDGEPEKGQAGDAFGADRTGEPADAPDAGVEDEPAKTLPPDLEAVAAGGGLAGPAPVHVGADFEQGQLYMAAAATLDRGVPGSAAVIDR